MMLNRQFEPPTFASINCDLKAFHAILYQFTYDFLETSKKEPFVQLADVNQDIRTTIKTLTDFEAELRKKSNNPMMKFSSTTWKPRRRRSWSRACNR
jgi:hypothetical protein